MKKKDKNKVETEKVSAFNAVGLPDTAFQMINNYGTYEVQATADTENQYPCIAQGYNPKIIKNDCENPHKNKDK